MEYTTNLNLKKPEGTDPADITDINDNMDTIDAGVKKKQTAVSDPTASGTALSFISNIAQDADGKITTLNKKTVADATTSTHGLMTATEKVKLSGIATQATKTAVTNNSATLSWGSAVNLASVSVNGTGTNITAKLPANPTTDLIKKVDGGIGLVSLSAGASDSINASTLIPSPPSGYTPIGFAKINTGHHNVGVLRFNATTGANEMIRIRNFGSNDATYFTVYVTVVYLRN